MNTVKMTAAALRGVLGDTFDHDQYEQGRLDFRNDPSKYEVKLGTVKRILESGNFRFRPGPSYWIGCLSEADFT